MRNKIALVVVMASLFSSSLSFAGGELKSSRLTINGVVTSDSCKVSVNNGDKNGVVELPEVNTRELANGSVVKNTTFDITLSNCIPVEKPDGGDGKISLLWTNAHLADANKGYLDNTLQEDAAKNVFLVMTNKDSDVAIIPGSLNETNVQSKKVGPNGTVKFYYKVGYVTTDKEKAIAGRVQSKIVYTIVYE